MTIFNAHLSPDMMLELGGYTHPDEAGQRMYLSEDTQQIAALCGLIRYHSATVHPATGMAYASDDFKMGDRIEVHPAVADWFDAQGELSAPYDVDGLTLTTPYVW